jgi:hypothetical protein
MFQKTWGDTSSSYLEYADELPEGGYIVAGRKADYITMGPAQFYIARLSETGDVIWQRDFGQMGGFDWLYQVLKTKQETYILAGNWPGIAHVVNVDKNGYLVFERFYYGNTNFSSAYGISQTDDDGFLIAGATQFSSQGPAVPLIIKTDPQGLETWRTRHDTMPDYFPRYILTTHDNGCLITGNTYTTDFGNSFVARFDANGNLNWIKYPYGRNDTIANGPASLFLNTDGSFSIPFNQEVPNSVQTITQWIDFDSNGNITDTTLIPIHLRFPFTARPAIDPFDSAYVLSNSPYPYEYGWIYKIYRDKTYELVLKPAAPDWASGGAYAIRTRDGGYLGAGTFSPDPINGAVDRFHIDKFASNLHYDSKAYDKSVKVYPNPSAGGIFNLVFETETDDYVEVKIQSIDGKLVFSDRFFCPANTYNTYPVHLDLRSGNSGMYFFEAKTSTHRYFKKLITVQTKE